jgi:hypothetical protein
MAIRVKAPEATEPVAAPAALPGATQVVNQPEVKAAPKVDYKAEERTRIAGQVRMHCIVAALQSPAGPAFAPTAEAYLDLVKKLADVAFEYTFQGESK